MKHIIIVNGKGGSGKDSMIRAYADNHTTALSYSSIYPIKEIAKKYGYDDREKTDAARKFLSGLKKVFTDWNEIPTKYLMEKTRLFLEADESMYDVMFVQIREPSEIEKFIIAVAKETGLAMNPSPSFDITTILVKRDETDKKEYGNSSDDDVENYKYDYIFENNKRLAVAELEFQLLIEENIIDPV
jgi:hypothetical protein